MTTSSDETRALDERRTSLRKSCRHFPGHGYHSPAQELERVAAICREQRIDFDVYGKGEYLQSFEEQVASRLGFEAARFFPSGTMAQVIALRLWSERAGSAHIALHPTSHLELHEERGYAHLHGLQATLIGPRRRPFLAGDLRDSPLPFAALVVELPTRENGGQLPSWDELNELIAVARDRNIRSHLDGARLWEAQAAYDRPFTEICALFDSAYVSFYKGIGALPGSMLLGPQDFLDEAAVWQRRHGGVFYTALANIVSAATRLESQIAKMPNYRVRALEVASLLSTMDGVRALPNPPQVNMFHLIFDADPEALHAARDQVAEEQGIWLMGRAGSGDLPGTARTEITIGDGALAISGDDLTQAWRRLLSLATQG